MIGPAELAHPAGPLAAPLLDRTGAVIAPVVAVDLDRPSDDAALVRAAAAVATSNRIVVGITTRAAPPLSRVLDLTLSTDPSPERSAVRVDDLAAALNEVTAAATANPHASTLLAGLLRWTGDLPVQHALEVESLAYSTLLGGPEFAGWLTRRGPRPLPPPPSSPPVLLARDDTRLTITLNRPERRNAFGADLRDALIAGVELAVADETIERVILRGAGRAFCSGGDLDEFGTTPDPVTAHLLRTSAGAARLLNAVAGRTEAEVHGPCVGAGIELPAFAGRITAAAGTTFRLPEIAMGLIPGAGGTISIPRRIGRWRTLHLALTGRPLDLATALEWGLVDG